MKDIFYSTIASIITVLSMTSVIIFFEITNPFSSALVGMVAGMLMGFAAYLITWRHV
jgi:hypothetical protein